MNSFMSNITSKTEMESLSFISSLDVFPETESKSRKSRQSRFSVQLGSSLVQTDFTAEDVKHKILTEKAKMNLRPHLKNTTRDYLTMIREENEFKNEPEWDNCQQCLMTDMIEAKKNYKLASELLEKKREEQAKTRSERDQKIKELEEDEQRFGASFVYFDNFVKENIEKRDRAIEKIKSEKAIRVELDQQIIKADIKIQKLMEIKNDMAQCISDRRIFVDFLENVRALAPNEFRNGVHEIAERYEILVIVREALAKEQEEAIKTMESLSHKMFKITDEHSENLINLRHKYTELYCRYDTAKHDALYWESIVNKIERMSAQETLQRSRVINACYILYTQICDYFNLPVTAAKSDLRKQLTVIEEAIFMLKRTLYIIKRKQERHKKKK